MRAHSLVIVAVGVCLASCQSWDGRETLARLSNMQVEIRDEQVEGGLEQAMRGYEQFLDAAPGSIMAPEAMRRLADLKIEREFGLLQSSPGAGSTDTARSLESPERHAAVGVAGTDTEGIASSATGDMGRRGESGGDSERHSPAAAIVGLPAGSFAVPREEDAIPESADAREAIAIYQKLLAEYSAYEHADQVLYQMARAYEELGEVDEGMAIMNQLASRYPRSRHIDEVQFRRGEYFFTRKKYLDAEEAYQSIAERGADSLYYELALYKLGWTLYKQELYEEGLHRFVALLDHKVATGFDFSNITDDIERKRIEDTYRVISYSFSYLGGADATTEYFARHGRRPYEANIYANLGEHYLEKRRYADAATSYKAFVALHPFHPASPRFDMRVIDIYKQGGFPQLVLDANKEFAVRYGLKSEYWHHFEPGAYPKTLGYLKKNLVELANYYHAQYQDPRLSDRRVENFHEATTWYGEFLESFPRDADSPGINYQLADLLLEHKDFARAASEYERTAYVYPAHEKSAAAGYAAVYAWREHLSVAPGTVKDAVQREIIRSSVAFADSFSDHEKAALLLGGAADELFELKDYALAEATARRVVGQFPGAEQPVLRAATLVVAHSTFELARYLDAEQAYANVLQLTADQDESRTGLTENLAASIYKQGEEAQTAGDFATAAHHFLRIGQQAPGSKIRPMAEFDGAVALIELEEWDRAGEVLQSFRQDYPGHELQPEATKRIALVYKEAGKLALAAGEYERIETESRDEGIRRSALLLAAELYEQGGQPAGALQAYGRYVAYFPSPIESALEARAKMAELQKFLGDHDGYRAQLDMIVKEDAAAGAERTQRTKYLAATAALTLAEPFYAWFAEVRLVRPFEANLTKKKGAMKAALDRFGQLITYEVGEVTAAATFYMAEIYHHFSESLAESERPEGMSALELEEYELALEEQAYPFEEKAIAVHEKNLELLTVGIYNDWIDRSIAKLASLMPARYARAEEDSGYIDSIDFDKYDVVRQPLEEPSDEAA